VRLSLFDLLALKDTSKLIKQTGKMIAPQRSKALAWTLYIGTSACE